MSSASDGLQRMVQISNDAEQVSHCSAT
jgi:hypothetical protein